MPHALLGQKRAAHGASESSGFSLLEMLTAVFVLIVGILALLPLVSVATRQNELTRYQTSATLLAQRQLEQICHYAFAPGGGFFDGDGNWIQVSCPDPTQESCGNPLNAVGLIDFSLDPLVGFSLAYQDPGGSAYDIRWNIQVTPSNAKQFVVGVRARRNVIIVPPVHLRTLIAP